MTNEAPSDGEGMGKKLPGFEPCLEGKEQPGRKAFAFLLTGPALS